MNFFNRLSIVSTLLLALTAFTSAAKDVDLISELQLKNATMYTKTFIVGGQPNQDDIKLLANNDVKRVINLRPIDEFSGFNEQAEVTKNGMEYINIPIAGAAGINLENLSLFNKAVSGTTESTLIHCASGNRVGALFALNAYYNEQKSIEESIAIGKKSGLTRLEAKVRNIIANNEKK